MTFVVHYMNDSRGGFGFPVARAVEAKTPEEARERTYRDVRVFDWLTGALLLDSE
jgi:hypothetical protein